MGLIETILYSFLTFISGIFGNIVASDLYARVPTFCEKIIRRAARRLQEPERSRYLEEWLSDLLEREGGFSKLKHSLGCLRSSGQLRRQATRVDLLVEIPLARGVVATSFRMNGAAAHFAFWAFRGQRTPFNYPFRVVCGVYLALKVIGRARRSLNRQTFLSFCASNWDQVRDGATISLKLKGASIDITEMCNLARSDPAKAQAALAAFIKRFRHPNTDLSMPPPPESPPTA